FIVITPTPPRSPLFPYTTLFRSRCPGQPGSRRRRRWCERSCASGLRGPPSAPHGCKPIGQKGQMTGATSVFLRPWIGGDPAQRRSEEHTSELQSLTNLVCRLLLE